VLELRPTGVTARCDAFLLDTLISGCLLHVASILCRTGRRKLGPQAIGLRIDIQLAIDGAATDFQQLVDYQGSERGHVVVLCRTRLGIELVNRHQAAKADGLI
jgi:hypothetical protein